MPDNSSQSSKRRKSIETPDAGGQGGDSGSEDEDDIEAQIRKEVEGLKPSSAKPRQFQAIRLDIPCGSSMLLALSKDYATRTKTDPVSFIRFDKSIDPEKLVHQICVDAHANPSRKRSRYIQRMTPVKSIRKTLSVDLEAFAGEILKPHFHSGGGPKKFAIRPAIRRNQKFDRDSLIKTVASVVGPEHSVDLENYDLIILVDIIQNVIGMSVAGSDYEKLKRYNLAELYKPAPSAQEVEPKQSTD
ncbi:THUMP domain protein [Aspergillus bombycis]|uniref:THUMP domain protein n=1 Tax=Aspergillus bombycis TaxID=109264 RepID=A0A1F7ZQP8_9EURO|nr:THUMP domain protein [Aspergillus bombycis]OGM41395.1 THUMP domain protein [Aspergillus bombycis]